MVSSSLSFAMLTFTCLVGGTTHQSQSNLFNRCRCISPPESSPRGCSRVPCFASGTNPRTVWWRRRLLRPGPDDLIRERPCFGPKSSARPVINVYPRSREVSNNWTCFSSVGSGPDRRALIHLTGYALSKPLEGGQFGELDVDVEASNAGSSHHGQVLDDDTFIGGQDDRMVAGVVGV